MVRRLEVSATSFLHHTCPVELGAQLQFRLPLAVRVLLVLLVSVAHLPSALRSGATAACTGGMHSTPFGMCGWVA